MQGGVAPFIVALAVALLLHSVRLGGLAVVAAFCASAYLVAGFTFTPLTATRKIVLIGLASPIVGMLADFAFKPTRTGSILIAAAAAGGALWAFWPVLSQKPTADALLHAGVAAVVVAFMVWFGQTFLAQHPVRAGSAGLALGLGVGVASFFAATLTYGLYGVALGAGSGAFLLVQMIRGRPVFGGVTFTLPAMLIGGLIGAGAMALAKLPWYAVAVLGFVPVAARLPLPQKAPVWLQATLLSLYGFIVAGLAVALAWRS